MLRPNLADFPVSDFQHWPSWRPLVVAAATELARFTGQHLIAPQTILTRAYMEQIFAGLREAGLPVFHVVLDADGDILRQYTEDAVLVSPNGTVQGRTAIREHWSQEKAAFPDRTLTVNVVVEQGDTIAAEWTWAGTHTGPLVLPDGTELPPTGKRVEGQGMDLAQLRDGKAAVLHQYWDNMAWARQLGLVP